MNAPCALITVYNHAGELLLGKRKDSGKLTLPAGHLNDNESPEDGARRELLEETSLNALTLSPVDTHTLPDGTVLHCFSAYVGTQLPHGENDPDQEVATGDWKFHDISEGLPANIASKLHGPKDVDHNLLLRLFHIKTKDQGVAKSESADEIERLLRHPHPAERTMALKLQGLLPRHLDIAAHDPHAQVHSNAIAHPLFDQDAALRVMGSQGNETQKRALLGRHDLLQPGHLAALYHSDPQSEAFHQALVQHPVLDADLARTIYNDPKVSYPNRLALMQHANLPADVLESAVNTALTVPGAAADLAKAALLHPNCPPALVEKVLRMDMGSPSQAHLRLLGDYILRNKPVSPQLIDEILDTSQMRPDLHGVCESALANPACTPAQRHRYLSRLLKPEPVEPQPLEKSESPYGNQEEVALHMLGFRPWVIKTFEAAAFLTGKPPMSPEQTRQCLYEHEHDVDAAALSAYGLVVTKENRLALAAVRGLATMQKSEDVPVTAESVLAPMPEGQNVAQAVQRAFQAGEVHHVKLGGKHSAGTLLAKDPKTLVTWLLKPGSGNQSSAAGAADDPISQSRREAAWYQIAVLWGIDKWYPQTELLQIDGHEYAAMKFLLGSYKPLEQRMEKDPNSIRQIMQPLLQDGTLHQLSLLDLVTGNPDSHRGNCLVDEDGQVKLIDHGSAFAGTEFDPANDKNSFVPAYLRAWSPENFNNLPVDKKYASLPRVSTQTEEKLLVWAGHLDESALVHILTRYGIEAGPTLNRLARFKAGLTTTRVDEVVNRMWVSI